MTHTDGASWADETSSLDCPIPGTLLTRPPFSPRGVNGGARFHRPWKENEMKEEHSMREENADKLIHRPLMIHVNLGAVKIRARDCRGKEDEERSE